MEGEDPTSLYTDNHGDRNVATQEMMQYGTTKGARGLKVTLINDPAVRFGTQLFASKLLHGKKYNEVNVGAIRATVNCAMGVMM